MMMMLKAAENVIKLLQRRPTCVGCCFLVEFSAEGTFDRFSDSCMRLVKEVHKEKNDVGNSHSNPIASDDTCTFRQCGPYMACTGRGNQMARTGRPYDCPWPALAGYIGTVMCAKRPRAASAAHRLI